MTTLYDGYAQPAFVILGRVEDGVLVEGFYDGSSAQNNSPVPFVVDAGQTIELHPVYHSSYTGAQVQYRVRHRLNMASGLVVDDTGAEVWTEWPEWTEPSGATPTAECTYTTSLGYTGTRRYVPGITLRFGYDLSEHDLHEVEVRARVYSASADRASAWSYGTARIAFQPQLSSYTAQIQANGSMLLDYASNWPRGTELRIDSSYDMRDGAREVRSASDETIAEGIGKALPSWWLARNDAQRKGSLWAAHARLVSADTMAASGRDGGCSSVADPLGGYLLEPGAHVDPQDVPVPSITIESVASETAVVSIACACDHVVARAEYDDADGRHYAVDLEVTGGSPNWTATLDAPPLGVPIYIKAACCNASGAYRLAEVEASAITAAHSILTGGGSSVVLTYNGEFSQSTDRVAEPIQTVGRKLPVSRHGRGVSRSLSVKGTILFPSVHPGGDMELSALSCLDDPHDWVYRNPRGMRKRVMVTSWGTEQDTGQLGRVAEVTINMEEVDG